MPHPLVKPLPSLNTFKNCSCVRLLISSSAAPICPENMDENFESNSMSCCATVSRSRPKVANTSLIPFLGVLGVSPWRLCTSFQDKLYESIMDTFMPCPAFGLCVWQAASHISHGRRLHLQMFPY